MSFKQIKKGVVKKDLKREIALFIDGIGLDLASKRLKKKIDLQGLVKGLTGGIKPIISRYYTLIPFEDDSRHRSYLDAVHRAGLDVVVKRLPPKHIDRQINVYPEISADLVAFGLGHKDFSNLSRHIPVDENFNQSEKDNKDSMQNFKSGEKTQKIATIVCPSWELEYPILLVKEFGVDTISADFGEFAGRNILKNASKWIDLSDSMSIWKE